MLEMAPKLDIDQNNQFHLGRKGDLLFATKLETHSANRKY